MLEDGGFSRTKPSKRPALRGEETEEEAAATTAGVVEPWVEAGPAANGKLLYRHI